MDAFDQTLYVKKIYSEELLELTRNCPECGTLIRATGNMFLRRRRPTWAIEYWCPVDKEYINASNPETDEVADEIARNHGE